MNYEWPDRFYENLLFFRIIVNFFETYFYASVTTERKKKIQFIVFIFKNFLQIHGFPDSFFYFSCKVGFQFQIKGNK